MGFVSEIPALKNATEVTFEALPISRPEREPVLLEVVKPSDAPRGALLPQEMDIHGETLVGSSSP